MKEFSTRKEDFQPEADFFKIVDRNLASISISGYTQLTQKQLRTTQDNILNGPLILFGQDNPRINTS